MVSERRFPVLLPLLLAGLAACALALLGALWAPEAALSGWLAAYVFWSAVPVGALGLLMMMRLIPGAWADELSLPAEACMLLAPLAVAAVLPVLLGMDMLYPWTAGVEAKGMRPLYLTSWFFILRTASFWAVVGLLLALLLLRRAWSTPVASGGLILFVLFGTTMAVDWLMSLEPDFHSSGFGLYVLSIQLTLALAVLIPVRLLRSAPPGRPAVLGGLLLTAILLWVYFAFMQYFIIWSGNLPPGVQWYATRATPVWNGAAQASAALQLLPALLLLFPLVRQSRVWLLVLCALVLAGKALEILWLVLPATDSGGMMAPFAFLLAWLGLGALSLAGLVLALPLARRLRQVAGQALEAAP
ncbi:hypothetical protein [Geminicoccus roseus]|uniref:hypothetical protein n=1 Tax=Geminicoccus roseus TaxID=404900 RepID=UPI000422236F|nr:hypothetical protein [Geminicoccus roseus]